MMEMETHDPAKPAKPAPPPYPSSVPDLEGDQPPPTYTSANPPSKAPYHYLRLFVCLSYAITTILSIVLLVPGSWSNSNSESWKPTLGLEIFSFEYNSTYTESTLPPSSPNYRTSDIAQIVIELTSTCITPETTIHGGGDCYSNLGFSTSKRWSINTIPSYNTPSEQYLNIPISAPEIRIDVITALLIIGMILSFIILSFMGIIQGCSGKVRNRDGSTPARSRNSCRGCLGEWGGVRPYELIGTIGLIFVVSGAALLRVQVNHTVAVLRRAAADEVTSHLLVNYTGGVEEDSRTFWNVMWTIVALMVLNPILLVVDGWKYPVN